MLLDREIPATDTAGYSFGEDTKTAAPALPDGGPAAGYGNRYGEGRRFSLSAVGITAAIHAALALALLGLGAHAIHQDRERLVTVDVPLAPPPPPPAPATPPQPADVTLDVQVQPPVIAVPVVVRPTMPIVLEPAPPQVQPSAMPAPPAAPAPPAPPAPPSVVSAADLGTRMIAGDPPKYPVESRRKKEQGIVELLLIIGPDGRVETISIGKSSGHERLDKAALNAVRKWRWSPTLRDGSPVKVRGTVEIPFVLQGVK